MTGQQTLPEGHLLWTELSPPKFPGRSPNPGGAIFEDRALQEVQWSPQLHFTFRSFGHPWTPWAQKQMLPC